MATENRIDAVLTGASTRVPAEAIAPDAASESLNFIHEDGRAKLAGGASLVGGPGGADKVRGLFVGYDNAGNARVYKKDGTALRYLNGATWQDVLTGLTEAHEMSAAPYTCTAGTFMFFGSRDGLWYVHLANPSDVQDIYDAAENFRGRIVIDKARCFLFDRADDKTGLYGSWIDAQNSTVYTTVSNESVGTGNGSQVTFAGTLAFKAGDAKRSCFGLSVDTSPGSITFRDDYAGNLVGSDGTSAGTINYMTGAVSLTFAVAPAGATAIRCSYQHYDPTEKSVADFSKSATRLAGEGFVLRQDFGGDRIRKVIPSDGEYFSVKETTIYRLIMDAEDVNPTNEVYRTDIGVPSDEAAVATGRGLIVLNTARPGRPQLTRLERNPLGDNLEPVLLAQSFDWSRYDVTDAALTTFGSLVLVAVRESASANDRVVAVDTETGAVSVLGYDARRFALDGGKLLAGLASSGTAVELFSGEDYLGAVPENVWKSREERAGDDVLKRAKKLRGGGRIGPNQSVRVYRDYDGAGPTWVGTIRGDGTYTYAGESGAVGTETVGAAAIGGDASGVPRFVVELKLRSPKYRQCVTSFEAQGYGPFWLEWWSEFDIWTYQQSLPARFRQKQNVSLDGTSQDVDAPEF